MFSLQQNWRTRGQNTFSSEVEGEVIQTMYTHVSKCKKYKIFKKKKKKERTTNTG
jgi:hypothetical protein